MRDSDHAVGVCLLDDAGTVLELDADFAKLVGCDARAASGRRLSELLDWAPRLDPAAPTLARHEQGERSVELSCRAMGAVGYAVTARVVTEESTLARQLRVARQTLDSVIEASPLTILTVDIDKRVVVWNRAAEETFGWTREELVGQPYPLVPAEEWAAFEELFERVVLRGRGFTGVEGMRARKDGTQIPVRMHTAPLEDGEGNVVGGMAVIEDLTEQRRLEERMRESQKMEAIGRLTGGIAHDFNNLLSVVIGLSDLLALEDQLSSRARECVGDIQRVAKSGSELVAKLMTFSRRQVVRPELLDLVERVRESGVMLSRLIRETIAIDIDTGDVSLWVRLDRSQLDQILVNLCVNAADAMVGGGRLSVTTSMREVGEREQGTLLRPGRYVCLSVRDTGVGIPEAVRSKIFEPFFTTKSSGTGLGLANVYAIAKQAGGEVEVDSVEGEGTEFRVYLPMQVPPSRRRGHSGPAAKAVARGSERILLVEDNDGVRRSTSRQLEAIGYRVETACDGLEALERMDAGLEVELVLSDLTMPRLGGAELARRLYQRQPELPVIIMSGDLDVEELREAVEQGRARFLQKPVSLRNLAQTLREVLQPVA